MIAYALRMNSLSLWRFSLYIYVLFSLSIYALCPLSIYAL